jgi:hypothetical protein
MRMWIIYASGNRNHGPDRLWENNRCITLSLMVVSDFLFRIRSIGLAGFPALVLGDRRYVSCFAFPAFLLGRVESRYSTGIDLRVILHYIVSLMRQEFVDDGRLFVGLGFAIGSQNEAEM